LLLIRSSELFLPGTEEVTPLLFQSNVSTTGNYLKIKGSHLDGQTEKGTDERAGLFI
jgi:hypothetical protein